MAELTKEDILSMFAETDRRLDQRFQETARIFRETDRRLDQRFQETDKELTRLERLFTGQWGKLIPLGERNTGTFFCPVKNPSARRILSYV